DQEAKRRQLEERLRATQTLLEATGEKLGEAWRDKDETVRRLEAKAFDDLTAQRRAADEVRDAQRKAILDDADRRERELVEEREALQKRHEAEWRDAEQQFVKERQRAAEDMKRRDEEFNLERIGRLQAQQDAQRRAEELSQERTVRQQAQAEALRKAARQTDNKRETRSDTEIRRLKDERDRVKQQLDLVAKQNEVAERDAAYAKAAQRDLETQAAD